MNNTIYNTIIVGAGISGLRAAQILQYKGNRDVLIVESRSRIGGRIYPIQIYNNHVNNDNIYNETEDSTSELDSVECGANWIHDLSKQNPIFRIAEKMGLKLVTMYDDDYELDPSAVIGDREYFKAHGLPRIYTREELMDANKIIEKIMYHASRVWNKLRKSKASIRNSISLAQGLRSALERLEAALSVSDSSKQLLSLLLEMEGMSNAADLHTLSFSGWYNGTDESENGEALVVGGISQILAPLSDGLNILLDCVVNEIEWGGGCCSDAFFSSHSCSGNPIKLHTSHGVLTAWNVIVTVSIGCLQNGCPRFSPSLPPEHVSSINSIRMGLLLAVALRFTKRFWPEDCKVFGVPPARSGLSPINIDDTETEFPLDDLFASFLSLSDARRDGQSMLLGYVYGSRAQQLEKMNDEDIKLAAFESLRMIFGEFALPPEECIFHRWGSDPYSYGSYSTVSLDSSPHTTKTLMNSMCCRKSRGRNTSCLQLAGEGTNYDLIGLLQGAYQSGERAATHILRCHKSG